MKLSTTICRFFSINGSQGSQTDLLKLHAWLALHENRDKALKTVFALTLTCTDNKKIDSAIESLTINLQIANSYQFSQYGASFSTIIKHTWYNTVYLWFWFKASLYTAGSAQGRPIPHQLSQTVYVMDKEAVTSDCPIDMGVRVRDDEWYE